MQRDERIFAAETKPTHNKPDKSRQRNDICRVWYTTTKQQQTQAASHSVMSHKNRITFTKPEEPAFIQRMKAKIGYKEGPTVDTKVWFVNCVLCIPELIHKMTFQREQLASADDPDDGRVEPDDEKPTVVVVKDGDLTAEEAEELQHDLGLLFLIDSQWLNE